MKIKKIGVLTSGGDAPGMNACIRAVVRASSFNGIPIVGIKRGYQGLIEGDFTELNSASVSNIIHRGGTILKSARCEAFKTEEGKQTAYKNLKADHIEGLIVIGGDGSFRGATDFSRTFNYPIIGIPATIDNDMYGTDYTIGYDTAVNTVVEAVDKIRDTASSHDRLFFVEVMGRDAGFIALSCGIAVGAEAILIPESRTDLNALIEKLEYGWRRKKSSSIVIVAEGDEAGGAFQIAEKVKGKLGEKYDIRVTILGHIQRGGSPTCTDRVMASRLGVAAVEALIEGEQNIMVGIRNNRLVYIPLVEGIKNDENEMSKYMLHLAEMMSF